MISIKTKGTKQIILPGNSRQYFIQSYGTSHISEFNKIDLQKWLEVEFISYLLSSPCSQGKVSAAYISHKVITAISALLVEIIEVEILHLLNKEWVPHSSPLIIYRKRTEVTVTS